MLNMESFLGSMALGEESLQMWDLNKRLEVYLTRVKSLEEENEFLRAEIQNLKGNQIDKPWRTKYEKEISALRATLEEGFSEKNQVEMTRDNLYEEIQFVKSRCQKERLAQEEAKKELSESKKMLEEEGRAQIWLKEKAFQLEKELESLFEVHEQEKAGLEEEMVTFSQRLENFRVAPVAFQPVEVEDYSKQLSEIWKGAVETYKNEVSVLEVNLSEAKEKLWKVVDDNRQNQLQLQNLEKELLSLKMQKEILQEHLSKEWQNQQQETEKFQLEIESLEQEKQNLRVQIAQILEDRQQLMHLKMSLSLEVATYRTLLEAESTRLQMPVTDYKLATTFREVQQELGSSRLQAVIPEARRTVSREYRLSSTPIQREERRAPPKKAPNAFFSTKSAISPKGGSPVTREFQKVNSVLQSHSLKYTSAFGLKKDTFIKAEKGQEAPKSDNVITKAKVESTSKPLFQDLSVLDGIPLVVSEKDILPGFNTVSYSETEQTESCLEVKAHQTPMEEFHKETKELNKDDQIPCSKEEQFSDKTMPESLTAAQLVTETLEAALKDIKESAGELNLFHSFAPDVEPSLFKAKEASYDLSSYDQEINRHSLPVEADSLVSTHIEMIQEDHIQGYDSQMPTSTPASKTDLANEAEASNDAPSDQGHYFENICQEADTGNSKDLESPYLEKNEESMEERDTTKQKIEVVSDIPFTDERCEADPSEDITPFQHATFDKGEPNLPSTENSEESEVISSYVLGSFSEHLKMPLGTEIDSHDTSRSDQDGPSSAEEDLEKFDGKESDFEFLTTGISEGEKAEELSSVLQGNEDYDSESQNIQESELLRIGMQVGEAVKHHESFFADTEEKVPHVNDDEVTVEQIEESKQPNEDYDFESEKVEESELLKVGMQAGETVEHHESFFADAEEKVLHVNEDEVTVEQVEESKQGKLADKEDIDVENATDITEVTSEWNTESPFVQETIDLTKDSTEEHENVDLEEDAVGQENQTETSNALAHENLRLDETDLEKENTGLIEGPFGQDILDHETLTVEEPEAVGTDEEKEENFQRPLPTESDSNREESKQDHSETEEATNIDFSYEATWGDPSATSAEMKDHRVDNLDSELRVVTDKEEVKDHVKEIPPTEYRNSVQEMETGTSFVQDVFLEEYMDITRKDKEDQSLSVQHVKETSVPENSEEQPVVPDESQKTEQYKDMPSVPTGLEIQEELPEEQKLGDSALTSLAYPIKSEYSDPENSAESQDEVTLNEFHTSEIKEQELEMSKEYILEQTLPDTTPLPSFDDEKVSIGVAVTESNKDDDAYLCTEGAMDAVSTSEEFTVSLHGTQHQIDHMSSNTAPKAEEDMVDKPETILNKNIENAEHIPYDHHQGMHDLNGSEASDNLLARDESLALKDDKSMYNEPDFSETSTDRLVPEMLPNKVIVSKQNEEEIDNLDDKSDDEVEIVLEETEDNEESRVKESYPEVSDLSFSLESKQDNFSKEQVLMYADDVEMVKESTLDLNYSGYVEAESIQSVSAPGTLGDILQRNETLQENEKEETLSPGCKRLVSSDDKKEELPSVTRTDFSSELDLSQRGHPDGKNGLDEVSQFDDDRNVSSPSQELKDKPSSENVNDYDPLLTEKQVIEFHADLLSSSDISNQSVEVEHPTQNEDIAADQHPNQNKDIAAEQQQVPSDSLFNTSETGALQEQCVLHTDKALLSEMEFAMENTFAEKNNSNELNALHTEMMNGYSYLEQNKKTVEDDQRSIEKLDGDSMTTSGEKDFAETVLTQELHEDKILLFPTSEVKSDGLFQTLLETSDKEAKELDEVLYVASDDEESQQSSDDNRCPEAEGTEDDLSNVIETPYVKGKYVHDQQHKPETNQHGNETLEGPGTEVHPQNEDSWSSEDD